MAKRTKADKSRLADLSKITEEAQEITGKDKSKTFSLDDTKPVEEETTPGLTAKNRAKFTTMLRPDLREKLDHVAKRHKMSIADVLEVVIEEYFNMRNKVK